MKPGISVICEKIPPDIAGYKAVTFDWIARFFNSTAKYSFLYGSL